jgi:hypothetical protein
MLPFPRVILLTRRGSSGSVVGIKPRMKKDGASEDTVSVKAMDSRDKHAHDNAEKVAADKT